MIFYLYLKDSDVVVLNGNATPHSAMSISPATSEVGSFLSSSSKNAAAKSHQKSNKNKAGHNNKTGPVTHHDRADLDFDWRSPAKVLSADEDPNWRERDHHHRKSDSENQVSSSPPWRLVKSSSNKSRKLQHQGNVTLQRHMLCLSIVLCGHFFPESELLLQGNATDVTVATVEKVSNIVHDGHCITSSAAAKEVIQNDGISSSSNSRNRPKNSKKWKQKNKVKSKDSSDTNGTSSKDTTAESDANINEMIPQVSRLSGHNKPKR